MIPAHGTYYIELDTACMNKGMEIPIDGIDLKFIPRKLAPNDVLTYAAYHLSHDYQMGFYGSQSVIWHFTDDFDLAAVAYFSGDDAQKALALIRLLKIQMNGVK
jgi:hypothetical protein